MYELMIDRLERAGLAMYEISNYARPGHESRHNLVYWANDAYFGVGLGRRGMSRESARSIPATCRPTCGGSRRASRRPARPRRSTRRRGPGRRPC